MDSKLNRITYVEDEPDIRAITQIALEQVGGYTLDVCSSGAEAVEKTSQFQPDLILMDVMMPEMDGIQTLQALRQDPKLSDTPVAFMTARVQGHEVNQYKEAGSAGVIAKPFDPMTLAEEVRAIWQDATDRSDK